MHFYLVHHEVFDVKHWDCAIIALIVDRPKPLRDTINELILNCGFYCEQSGSVTCTVASVKSWRQINAGLCLGSGVFETHTVNVRFPRVYIHRKYKFSVFEWSCMTAFLCNNSDQTWFSNAPTFAGPSGGVETLAFQHLPLGPANVRLMHVWSGAWRFVPRTFHTQDVSYSGWTFRTQRCGRFTPKVWTFRNRHIYCILFFLFLFLSFFLSFCCCQAGGTRFFNFRKSEWKGTVFRSGMSYSDHSIWVSRSAYCEKG